MCASWVRNCRGGNSLTAYVELSDCKLVGNVGWDVLKNQMDNDNDTRVDELVIDNCQFDEELDTQIWIPKHLANRFLQKIQEISSSFLSWLRFINVGKVKKIFPLFF